MDKADNSPICVPGHIWRRAAITVAVAATSVLIWLMAILLPGIGQELVASAQTAFLARLIVASTIVILGLPFLLLSGMLLVFASRSLRKSRLLTGLFLALRRRDPMQAAQALQSKLTAIF